ncbi:MAG: hypothetical protein ACNA8W_24570, partial [Bradymonadaceae bacterium]
LIDPACFQNLKPTRGGHVGLLNRPSGPPLGLRLGEIVGAETWNAYHLLAVPPWLSHWLPTILRPGCAPEESGKVVWLLDLDTLDEMERQSPV